MKVVAYKLLILDLPCQAYNDQGLLLNQLFKIMQCMDLKWLTKALVVVCLFVGKVVEAHPGTPYLQNTKNQPSIYHQTAAAKLHNLLHTQLEIKFDWEQQHLQGIATLQVQAHFYPQDQLILDAQDLVIHEIAMLEGSEKRALQYVYAHKKLIIDLGKHYTKEEPCWIEIAYTVQANTAQLKMNAPITGNQGLQFINPAGQATNKSRQIWTLSQPASNSCWFPTIDAPNQKCTQEVYITVEDQYKTLSNGVLVYTTLNEDQTRTDYWSMELPHAPYLSTLVVGEFAEIQDEWNDIPVNYYVAPAYAPYAKATFGHTPEMLELFSEKLDYPYPWPQYSQVIVQDYPVKSSANTTCVVFSDALQVDERELLDQDPDDQLAHAVLHHWFGNLVTCRSWRDASLHESLAGLGPILWQEYKHGSYARDWQIWHKSNKYLKEAQAKPVALIKPYSNQLIANACSHNCDKGTLVLYMLKHYLGDAAFFQSLSHYLKQHAFTAVDMHELQKAFEAITGEDLHWFFQQWFLLPGHPMLRAAHSYAHGIVTLKVWQNQRAPSPVYGLPLTVGIWVQGSKEQHKVFVDKPYQEFQWAVSQEPALVYIDQQDLLVGETKHPKTAQEYQYLYEHEDTFFAKHEAISQLIKHYQGHPTTYYAWLCKVLQDPYWFFRVMAIQALAGYKEANQSLIANRLITVSQKDSHAAVRAAAIQALSTFQKPSQYGALYQTCFADSSYQVASMALQAYITTSQNPVQAPVLAKFEESDHVAIITVLANYYLASKRPGKYKWFADKIARLYHKHGFEDLLPLFGMYVGLMGDSQAQANSLELLSHIVKRSSRPKLQLAAYNALKQFPKTKAVKKILHALEASDQHKNLSR